jgi:hypothetical protein
VPLQGAIVAQPLHNPSQFLNPEKTYSQCKFEKSLTLFESMDYPGTAVPADVFIPKSGYV